MRVDPSKNIPTSSDSSEVWIEWYKALKKWFSKNEANTHFVRFWNQRAGAGTEADTTELRKYMKDQGVNLSTTSSGKLADMGAGFMDWVSGIGKIILIFLIVGGVVVIGVYAFKKVAPTAVNLKQLK